MNEPVPLSQSGIRWLWIAALVIVLDQLSKLWVQHNLALYETVRILPMLNIFHTFNRGAAWSLCDGCGGWQRWMFAGLAVVVSIALVFYLRTRVRVSQWLLGLGLTLIVGGAIGNLVDRIYLGHVVDFIQTHWGPWYFPSFNVADSAISVGAVLVVFESLIEAWRERQAARAAKPPGQGA